MQKHNILYIIMIIYYYYHIIKILIWQKCLFASFEKINYNYIIIIKLLLSQNFCYLTNILLHDEKIYIFFLLNKFNIINSFF